MDRNCYSDVGRGSGSGAVYRYTALAAIATIVFGAGIRIASVAMDRSLWFDEAMISLNIAARPFNRLLGALDYDQSAPVLFLWLERLSTRIFGVNEFALRLIPLLGGVALLIVLWRVGSNVVGEKAALLAIMLASFSTLLIGYSGVVKQYGIDALATVIIVGLTVSVIRSPDSTRRWCALALGGAVMIALSQPTIFVLGAAGICLLLQAAGERGHRTVAKIIAAGAFWLAIFAILFLASYGQAADNQYLQRFFARAYLNLHPSDLHFQAFLFGHSLMTAALPSLPALVGVGFPLVFLVGLLAIFRRHGRVIGALFATPYCLLFLANALGKYPIVDRLALFLSPLLFLIYAVAALALIDLLPEAQRNRIFVVVCLCVAVWGIFSSREFFVSPPIPVDPTRQLIREWRQVGPGEPVYVLERGLPAWVFYTTDWFAPDTVRLRWMANIASSQGPAFQNRAARGHRVEDEGDELHDDYQGRREIIGVGTGQQFRIAPYSEYENAPIDAGWADNEARRLRAATDSTAWIFAAHNTQSQLHALLEGVADEGGRVIGGQILPNAALLHLRFPVRASLGRVERGKR